MKYKLYLAVTPDRYELPIAVFDSVDEISNWANTSKNNVLTSICEDRRNLKNNCKFRRVIIDEDFY